MLTQERIKELLDYDPLTGIFSWRQTRLLAGGIASHGYIRIKVDRVSYRAHRLVWLYIYGEWPQCGLDHINGIKFDNRVENLRIATQSENMQNVARKVNNISGVLGVSWYTRRNRWRAHIKINGAHKYLGNFVNFFDAVCARKSAELVYHPFRAR